MGAKGSIAIKRWEPMMITFPELKKLKPGKGNWHSQHYSSMPETRPESSFLILGLFLYTLLHLPSEQAASLAFAQTTAGPHVSSDSHRLFAPDTHLLCRPELTVR